MRTEVFKNNKITFIIEKNSIIIFDKIQAISCNTYGVNGKQALKKFRKNIYQNYQTYTKWSDILDIIQSYELSYTPTRVVEM